MTFGSQDSWQGRFSHLCSYLESTWKNIENTLWLKINFRYILKHKGRFSHLCSYLESTWKNIENTLWLKINFRYILKHKGRFFGYGRVDCKKSLHMTLSLQRSVPQRLLHRHSMKSLVHVHIQHSTKHRNTVKSHLSRTRVGDPLWQV